MSYLGLFGLAIDLTSLNMPLRKLKNNSINASSSLRLGSEESLRYLMNIDYKSLYDEAILDASKLNELNHIGSKIVSNINRYKYVSDKASVPWYLVAAIHNMECSLNFNCHLHNGDPLTARTTHVPKGHPVDGQPPFTWEDSAVDAITTSYNWKPKDDSLWTIAQCLEFMERYNGLGYAKRGINTPYLWSGTSLYTKGLFVADNRFDPEAVSKQIGAGAIFKMLESNGLLAQ